MMIVPVRCCLAWDKPAGGQPALGKAEVGLLDISAMTLSA